MNKKLKTILIILGIIVLLTIPIIGSYNKMVTLDQTVKSSASDIDVYLKRRTDLIPNLVETVKGYAKQEKEIYTQIAESRSKLNGASTIKEKAAADSELSSALSRLLVVVERYPELKSNQNFKDLTVALEGAENRISIARNNYNRAVDKYNTSIKKFPSSIIANIFGFKEKPYYKAEEGAKEVPKVDFGK